MVFASMEKSIENGSSPVMIQPSANTVARKSKRIKYVIVGVSVIDVTLVAVGGFLGAMYLLSDTANTALKMRSIDYSDKKGNHVEETYEEYPDDVRQYTVNKGDDSFTVVEDFGRRLRVLNTTYQGKRACLLTPLNVTFPEPNEDENEPPKDYVLVDDNQIVDRDILGRHAQTICAGAPLYWALHMDSAQDAVGRRQKRGAPGEPGVIHCDRCDCYGCSRVSRRRRDVYHCAGCVCSGCR